MYLILDNCRQCSLMKLHLDNNAAQNTITGYGSGWLAVNGARHSGPIIVAPDMPVTAWPVGEFDALAPEDFTSLAESAPEIVLIGTGEKQRFVNPRLTRELAEARIGVESMDTRAACRTYNILIGEGRRVIAALLPISSVE